MVWGEGLFFLIAMEKLQENASMKPLLASIPPT